jgi:hypothetical protein
MEQLGQSTIVPPMLLAFFSLGDRHALIPFRSVRFLE